MTQRTNLIATAASPHGRRIMQRMLLATGLCMLAVTTQASPAFAWQDGDKYNVCTPVAGKWAAVQVPVDDWAKWKAKGAIPYEGSTTDHKPSGATEQWCKDHGPKLEQPATPTPPPAQPVQAVTPVPAPQPAVAPVVTQSVFEDFQGK